VPYEEVHVWNVTRGTRFRTYAMLGERGTGTVCANGAAALLVEKGDLVIIATFTQVETAELREFKPRIVIVDANNRVKATKAVEKSGPPRGEVKDKAQR
jgi:aspartate 1-decarboxylase